MICKPGCIALIPFPFTDLSARKKRPVLSLTAPDALGDFLAMAITSAPQHENTICLTNQALIQGSLPKTSYLRTDKVFTLSSSLILKQIAVIKPEILNQAIDQLCKKLDHDLHF